ncbi:MAG TPA: hypothetical protein VMJ33_11465 [Gallionella sp.]|nr:hypothetical protein [Gallionella sp.]
MDETSYRQILSATIQGACPFEKSILSSCSACSKADKRNIAEREAVACNDREALDRCIALRDLLRHNFSFALGRLHIDGPLPHAQEMRVQCGGLRGLQYALDESDEVRDVSALVTLAQQKFGGLADFPYSMIVQRANIVYKGR